MRTTLTRLEGWESRLTAVIDDARSVPYALGVHDCFWLACGAVKALTGVDLWQQWAGRYHTKRDALRLILEHHGGGFTPAFSRLFGSEPVPITRLRRGDIVEYYDREQHLGVCVGAQAALFAEIGVAFIPIDRCTHGWRIG